MKKNILIPALVIIIILGGFLRFHGADWGIPKVPYWRNHFQDEAFVLATILRMGPDNLNPHYFINPSFHFYTVLFSLKIASIINYIKPFSLPVKVNKLGQPVKDVSMQDYSKMYSIGRFITIIESIILIFLVFLIGRNLYSERVGIMAAAFVAVLPTFVYQSHFFVVDAPAAFWLILAFFFLTTKINPQKMTRWFILAGIFFGIAVGTKYLNILLVLPLLYKIYSQNRDKKKPFIKKIITKYTFITTGVAIIVFFLTTPYAILAFNEFLHGDATGFGGMFGRRGLTWALWETNFITPFTLSTFHSLRLPLTIFGLLGLLYLFYKRKHDDVFLLLYIIPFYALLIYHASPHLRHILPVLPFLMIAMARMFEDFFLIKKYKFIKPIVFVVIIFIFTYTFLFSLSWVKRITPVDSRIECADWVKEHVPKEARIGLPSYFPFNYTPPIEMITKNIVVTGFNYENLLAAKPNYYIVTEHEYREFPYARENKYMCKKFVEGIFSEDHYKIIKEFKKDFKILGITFSPNFPNMDWDQVNPKIYIFSRNMGE